MIQEANTTTNKIMMYPDDFWSALLEWVISKLQRLNAKIHDRQLRRLARLRTKRLFKQSRALRA